MTPFAPGNVKIYSAVLQSKTNGAELDITPQIKNISVYETINAPTIFCEILIEDSIDLWRTFPINGEEQLTLSYKTPGVEEITIYSFDIFKVKDKADIPTKKVSTYILQGVSTESIQAIKIGRLNLFFETPIENIVNYILSDQLQTKKQVYVERTKGIVPITIPNLYAFQAIEFLKERACSSDVPNSSFVFYENQYGFHFRTLESLIYTKRNDIGSKEFTYDNSALIPDSQVKASSYRSIIVLDKKNIANIVDNIGAGGYNNVVETFDIITKGIEKTYHNFATKASQFVSSDKISTPYNTQQFFVDLNNTAKKAKTFFNAKDSSLKMDFSTNIIGNKTAFRTLFNTVTLNALVYGDSSLTVGETIKLKTPNNKGTTDRVSDEAKISGIYMITSLRHLISPGPGAVHYTAMKLQKMGYGV